MPFLQKSQGVGHKCLSYRKAKGIAAGADWRFALFRSGRRIPAVGAASVGGRPIGSGVDITFFVDTVILDRFETDEADQLFVVGQADQGTRRLSP